MMIASRLLAVGILLMAACGDSDGDGNTDVDSGAAGDSGTIDSGDTSEPVVDLTDPELVALCEDFHDRSCPTSTDDFCAASCKATCAAAGTAALVRQECVSPITVAQVERCGDLFGAEDPGAFDFCTMGGGCIFDVFDQTCP